jgi:hypothetical protein
MEKVVSDNQQATEGAKELDSLKHEVKILQKHTKDMTFGEMLENSELEKLRKEVFSLEKLLIDLNGEYEEKGTKQEAGYDWEDE